MRLKSSNAYLWLRCTLFYGTVATLASTATVPVFGQELAHDVIGSWKLISHTVTLADSTFDAHAALLQQRPCAANIRYLLTADARYRLDASASDCDERYKTVQEKLYSKTKWRLDGSKITLYSTNFSVGQSYAVSVTDKRMTWIGTEGQGTLVFER